MEATTHVAHLYKHLGTNRQTATYVPTNVCTLSMHVYKYVYMYVRMYVCMYVRMYVCMYVRMYVCTYN